MQLKRILFMGSPQFAVPTLAALCAASTRYQVVGVVCQPDKPAGRGRQLTPCAVKSWAEEQHLSVLTPTRLKAAETAQSLAQLAADVAVVAAYGRLLPPALLSLPTHGCINVHASLLPKYRGAAPIAHAMLAGESATGVSIMRMDEGLDTGPVYATASTPIEPEDTCGTLTTRLAELGAALLLETLPAIIDGSLAPTAQEAQLATYAPMLRKEDGLVNFARPAAEVCRRVQALLPWPGSYAIAPSGRVQILRVQLAPTSSESAPAVPGTVLAVTPAGVQVACGTGAVLVVEVKPEARRAMAATAWAAGRGIAVGQAFLQESYPG